MEFFSHDRIDDSNSEIAEDLKIHGRPLQIGRHVFDPGDTGEWDQETHGERVFDWLVDKIDGDMVIPLTIYDWEAPFNSRLFGDDATIRSKAQHDAQRLHEFVSDALKLIGLDPAPPAGFYLVPGRILHDESLLDHHIEAAVPIVAHTRVCISSSYSMGPVRARSLEKHARLITRTNAMCRAVNAVHYAQIHARHTHDHEEFGGFMMGQAAFEHHMRQGVMVNEDGREGSPVIDGVIIWTIDRSIMRKLQLAEDGRITLKPNRKWEVFSRVFAEEMYSDETAARYLSRTQAMTLARLRGIQRENARSWPCPYPRLGHHDILV